MRQSLGIIISSAFCQFVNCTVYVFRLNKTSLSMMDCIRKVWNTEGPKGFYRGLTASYAGIVETVIYFTIYEHLRVNCCN